jgi:hypothetical protein
MKKGTDIVVSVGPREAWRLVDHCVTSYLELCERMGVKVQGLSVPEALRLLGQIKRPEGAGVTELVASFEKDVRDGYKNSGVQV